MTYFRNSGIIVVDYPNNQRDTCWILPTRGQGTLSYWRSKSGFEVDFILSDRTAIEVKAKTNIADKDLRGLKALQEEALLDSYIVVCLEDNPRVKDGISILPWQVFLDYLWQDEYS